MREGEVEVSSARITVDQLASTIMKELQDYSKLTSQEMKASVRKTASTARKEVQEGAPVRTGKYKKSWSTKVQNESSVALKMVVYSPSRYQIAHLLEFGHAKRNGGRTRAFPHVVPAEENAVKNLEIEIRKRIGG